MVRERMDWPEMKTFQRLPEQTWAGQHFLRPLPEMTQLPGGDWCRSIAILQWCDAQARHFLQWATVESTLNRLYRVNGP